MMSQRREVMSTPLMCIFPEVGTSSKFIHRKKVDLPEPEGPIIATTSPFIISVEIPCKTLRFPNDLNNSSILTATL